MHILLLQCACNISCSCLAGRRRGPQIFSLRISIESTMFLPFHSFASRAQIQCKEPIRIWFSHHLFILNFSRKTDYSSLYSIFTLNAKHQSYKVCIFFVFSPILVILLPKRYLIKLIGLLGPIIKLRRLSRVWIFITIRESD